MPAATADVTVEILRFVDDDCFPSLVEAVLLDAYGRTWSFIDKAPIFAIGQIDESDLPITGAVPCLILRDGTEGSKVISTAPGGVDSDGRQEFEVPAESLLPR